jgi:DNA-3-methyladenine glycosylase I
MTHAPEKPMSLTRSPDGQHRCAWVAQTTDFIAYHDDEWGWPVADDRHLFEKLCLESFQSGLSWRTILSKRENFRSAFHNFDLNAVAQMTERDVQNLLQDAGIIRHRGKIEAVINNARRAEELVAETGTLAAYIWSWEPKPEELGPPQSLTTSASSHAMSKDLKKRGWKFVGPTTVFAFMQSMGLLNDHAEGCCIRAAVDEARAAFTRPA